jgi:hypothetical protein
VERSIVGFITVPQTIPFEVTADPPSDDMFPPLVAVVPVMEEIAAVAETVGVVAVVKVIFGP